MDKKSLILGTRGSALALAQSNEVRALINRAFPKLQIELKIIKTSGDKNSTASLSKSGIKGFFTKEIEQALLLRKIDFAVHSLKDMLTDITPGLTIAATLKRVDANDVIVLHPQTDPARPGRIFSSSPRRKLLAKQLWPEAEIKEIRGNVETRLRKLESGKPGDATILAAAGLLRLDILPREVMEGELKFDPALKFKKLPVLDFLPSPGQAAIAVQTREGDLDALEAVRPLNHAATYECVMAERSFLQAMGGGCATPIGANAMIDGDNLNLKAVVGTDDHSVVWKGELKGPRTDYLKVGQALALKSLEYFKSQSVTSLSK